MRYISQYKFSDCKDKNSLPFDLYLPEYNTIIETDGEQHYRPIKWSSNITDKQAEDNLQLVQFHDKIKTEYCYSKGINLIRIPYWKKENIKEILCNKLNV